MCWYCRTIGQRLCYLCDTLLTGTVCLGGISTATTTTLQYKGFIEDWKAIAIPSVITFIAIMGCVLRCACRTQSQSSYNSQKSTIIINNHSKDSVVDPAPIELQTIAIHDDSSNLKEAIAIPVYDNQKVDMLQQIHSKWRNSQTVI